MREPPEYTAFVAERSPRLLRTAYLLCQDWAAAEDLLQIALVRVWRAWRRIEHDPDAYAYRVLVNVHSSAMRRLWRGELTRRELPDVPSQADAAGAVETRSLLWAALGTLPPRQRAVLVLRYFEDLSEPQVAGILGCSVGTVKSQASRALAKLRVDPNLVTAARPEGD